MTTWIHSWSKANGLRAHKASSPAKHVISQEDGARAPRKPWIQVAPVFRRIFSGTSPQHVVMLDGPELAQDSVADLRIEMPVEKGWLVDQTPLAGFSDSEGFRRLARRLALVREREAFPQWVNRSICGPLRDEDGLRNAGLLEGVEEIRVAFSGDDLSTTKAAGLVVLVSSERSIPQLGERWSDWCEQVASELSHDAHLLPVLVLTPDSMSAREHQRTAPVAAFSSHG
jgi:hypothetical protein